MNVSNDSHTALIFKALGISRHPRIEKTRTCSIEVLTSLDEKVSTQVSEQSQKPATNEAKNQLI